MDKREGIIRELESYDLAEYFDDEEICVRAGTIRAALKVLKEAENG